MEHDHTPEIHNSKTRRPPLRNLKSTPLKRETLRRAGEPIQRVQEREGKGEGERGGGREGGREGERGRERNREKEGQPLSAEPVRAFRKGLCVWNIHDSQQFIAWTFLSTLKFQLQSPGSFSPILLLHSERTSSTRASGRYLLHKCARSGKGCAAYP